MQSRLSDLERIKFRSDLGFNQINLILKKKQTVLKSINDAFEGEDMRTQYTVVGYKIDLYFHKHKVDELGHIDKNLNHEIERQNIQTHYSIKKRKQNKIKKKKKEQKSNFANELLTYVSNISISLKPVKYFIKKNNFHI